MLAFSVVFWTVLTRNEGTTVILETAVRVVGLTFLFFRGIWTFGRAAGRLDFFFVAMVFLI